MSAAAGAIVLAGRLMFAWFFGPVAAMSHIRRDSMMQQGVHAPHV